LQSLRHGSVELCKSIVLMVAMPSIVLS
jgi:hypothetical protein